MLWCSSALLQIDIDDIETDRIEFIGSVWRADRDLHDRRHVARAHCAVMRVVGLSPFEPVSVWLGFFHAANDLHVTPVAALPELDRIVVGRRLVVAVQKSVGLAAC